MGDSIFTLLHLIFIYCLCLRISAVVKGVICVIIFSLMVPFPHPNPLPELPRGYILVLRSSYESEQTARQTAHIVEQTEHVVYD